MSVHLSVHPQNLSSSLKSIIHHLHQHLHHNLHHHIMQLLSFSACCYRFEALSCADICSSSGVFEKFGSTWTLSLTVLKNYKMKSFPHYLLSGFTARKFKLKSSQATSNWTASIISCFLPILDASCFIHPDNNEGIESTFAWWLL